VRSSVAAELLYHLNNWRHRPNLVDNLNRIRTQRDYALYGLVILTSLLTGIIGFLVLCIVVGTKFQFQKALLIITSLIVVLLVFLLVWLLWRWRRLTYIQNVVVLSVLLAVATALALSTAYQVSFYIRLPVDLLSFSESGFVNDILKLRMGAPLYTPPQDNNSYPYTPGAQILTYLISTAFGQGESIPFFRTVNFSYVIIASLLAVSISDLLVRGYLSENEYKHRPLWLAIWVPLLFLVALDPQFNIWVQSLHNDSLALLVSIFSFWVMVKHSINPKSWQMIMMVVLPALGFFVKQNQLMWVFIFFVYLTLSGTVSFRKILLYLIFSTTLVLLTIGICYLLWGSPFIFWAFQALGQKVVSIPRSALHLLWASSYVIVALFSCWVLIIRHNTRKLSALWICWFILFGIETYTSGFAFNVNHMGPGVVLAVSWFFVALVKIWPVVESNKPWWVCRAQEVVLSIVVVLLFGGTLNLTRLPINPIPQDFYRYVNDIESEFQGMDPHKVLMDTGSWIYLRDNVLMKDRSVPVSVHVGINQPQISHEYLQATIDRIDQRTYTKILARELDTANSWYDFQDRGSGVKGAILANYHVVRRIPKVKGIYTWWPNHLIAEILVLEPNQP
jgi:hypothetical protein